MRVFNAEQTAKALPWRPLIEALRLGLNDDVKAPLRHHHTVTIPGEKEGTLLLMPAWLEGAYLGLKQVLVVPDNTKRGLASVAANYYLNNAVSGAPLAVIDGNVLTHRRTASVSALAADYLARKDAKHLLIVGTGGLAPNLAKAHATVRNYHRISIWGRAFDKANALAQQLSNLAEFVQGVESLTEAIQQADVISTATLAEEPLVLGHHIRHGTHVDLVGAFTPAMRESDDALMQLSTLFVDNREGAISEAGDIVQAINSGALCAQPITADILELTGGQHQGRSSEDEITVFKMVGCAQEDLITARFLWESLSGLNI